MKTICVIPIKLNNERLPNKNIKSFENGEPLISYILKTILKVKMIDEIYVYCSNEKIKRYLPEGVSYLKRSKKFDSSKTNMNEILKEFATELNADIYVLAHATSPFISMKSIEKGLINVIENEYDSSFAVRKIQEFLWKSDSTTNYDLNNIPRTQDLETIYVETSGFYIFKKDLILNEGRRIGHKPKLIEVSKIEGTDIDDSEDFKIANAIYNTYYINNGEMNE